LQLYFVTVKGAVGSFQGGGGNENISNICKKYRKIALFSLFQGGQQKKTEKQQKKAENITFKPLSTIFVPCLKIQGAHGPPAHGHRGQNSPQPCIGNADLKTLR